MKTIQIKKMIPLIGIAMSLSFFSCRSSKELMYMKDVHNNQMIKALADTATEYIIEPGDILYVSIKSMNAEVNALFNPESNMEMQSSNSYQKYTTPQGAYLYGFEVNDLGNLTLPIIGEIPVAGNPNSKIEKIVQQYADKYLKEAIVKVKLLNYKVTIMGEVKSPGVYYNYNNNFTILEALAMANGNTDYANITNIMVIRPQPDGQKAMILDMSASNSWAQKGFYLHPNDYIFVEPDKHKNFQLNAQAYSMIISSASLLLAVIGLLR
ncbi:polysaccharide biosynthesis/export family protein [Maribellus sp. CM-23]|uniref:polysaccharide biosynthesis/export family protein n=1 Tax=Maribellus sp. CM-23 TaxID=2781026 RepID=UPI001F3F1E67|nr:polysaccharide biosynthesis/export family protein [Maribellus sp. CM-23]MCE4566495.1 polysaccharide biosynthesis/export family protein [Maribellus sp. CM-23]